MKLKAGDIIYVYCTFVGDYKYVICLCPKYPYFFLINSEPRRITPDAQIKIKKVDFPFLSHDSYINTATICTIYPDEINKATPKGSLPSHIKAEIIEVVNKHRYLSPNQKILIKTNLSP
jgi:hypothetical protein